MVPCLHDCELKNKTPLHNPKIIESHTVPPLEESVRLSDYLRNQFLSIPSRKGMKKAVDRQRVWVNGTPASTATRVHGGETLELLEEISTKKVFEKKLEILFEDEYLAVVNKPAGILVSGNAFKTIENALPFNVFKATGMDALDRPQAIHRLDFGTSGVLLIGKTKSAVIRLNRMFEERKVRKIYRAICCGRPEKSGAIDSQVDGKHAKTIFEVLNEVSHRNQLVICDLKIELHTGRKHQIRKHFSELGHPLLGDVAYGGKSDRGIYLHAHEIEFTHPFTLEKLSVQSELPRKFRRVMTGMSR